jgi:hypothetical protein
MSRAFNLYQTVRKAGWCPQVQDLKDIYMQPNWLNFIINSLCSKKSKYSLECLPCFFPFNLLVFESQFKLFCAGIMNRDICIFLKNLSSATMNRHIHKKKPDYLNKSLVFLCFSFGQLLLKHLKSCRRVPD